MKLKDLTKNQLKDFYKKRAQKANEARQKKLTPEQRSELAKKAGLSTKMSKMKQGNNI